jgi:transcriptional regulator with XRE-family HTH domain
MTANVSAARLSVAITASQRGTLERWARARRAAYRLVIRSRIVLRSAAGRTDREIAEELRVSPLTVACWRSRFALLGLDGIGRDAPRVGSRRQLSESAVRAIIARTLRDPPPTGGAWSARSLGRAVGVSHSTVLRVWRAHQMRPDATRLTLLARDRRSQVRSLRLLGIYVDPSRRLIVMGESPRALRAGRSPRSLPATRKGAVARVDPPSPTVFATELARQLERMEPRTVVQRSARIARKEFLAFLGSVSERCDRATQLHLIASPSDACVRDIVRMWGHHRPISLTGSESGGPFHADVTHWLSERSRIGRTEVDVSELPRLREATERWTSTASSPPGAFAWMSVRGSRAAALARGPDAGPVPRPDV